MRVGSLFAGIGGFDLGLERAGMKIQWQVEVDEWCRSVLEKNWPAVQRYGDIKTLDPLTMEPVDVLCGGFPCQDLSLAGKRLGLKEGTRSGLWIEFARFIRLLRPKYVVVENVPGLLVNHAMGRVLGDLADIGYDAEWDCLSAHLFGLPHLRKRIWIVAYPVGQPASFSVLNRNCKEIIGRWKIQEKWGEDRIKSQARPSLNGVVQAKLLPGPHLVGRYDGIPNLLDRIRGLGSAVVPQVVEFLGEMIMRVEASKVDIAAKTKEAP